MRLAVFLIVGLLSAQSVIFPGPGAANGAPFSPSDLSGLQVWHAADTGNNCSGSPCTNGATQTTWADKSVNGNTATQTGVGPDIYNTSQINGQPAVTFSASTFTWATPINLQTASTIFTVMKLTTTAANQVLVTGTVAGAVVQLLAFNNSGIKEQGFSTGVVNAFGTTAADTSWHQINSTYDNTTAVLRIDRASDGSTVLSSAILQNSTGFGSYTPGGIFSFTGQLAELIIYNRVLTGPEITQVETYLNGRYGL